jgi:hypothetical protein
VGPGVNVAARIAASARHAFAACGFVIREATRCSQFAGHDAGVLDRARAGHVRINGGI